MVEEAEPGSSTGEGKRTVVVGVKLDSQSKELLTWALVKVALPGDQVIALHVLDSSTECTSSLLSLVKTFDSVLSVYEGFCNLKQVDLKLKVCRGKSARKILVREAKCYPSATLVIGTSKTHHRIRSSASVAKHCAAKLPGCFAVFAVNNGKVVFRRESMDGSQSNRNENCLALVQKNVKILNEAESNTYKCHHRIRKSCSKCRNKNPRRDCVVSEMDLVVPDNSVSEFEDDFSVCDGEDNSLALVPVQTHHAAFDSLVIQHSQCSKPGWALLRRLFLPKQQDTEASVKKSSVFQWVLRLPSWHSSVVYPDQKQSISNQDDDHCFSALDGENQAIVPFGHNTASPPLSPNNGLESLLKELLNLHENYSATCRLFSFQELLQATSNFLPENMVGRGGSSRVYRGCLPDRKELAVKLLKPSEDVIKEFVQEIDIITTLHHKNIISLFGFCFEDDNLLLVYEFLPRGSLEENLHGNKKDGHKFGWQERYCVAVGVAEALDYLHNRTEPVIHRDVKSSNILLSDDFEPQLADFGLASWASASSHFICTDVAGTFGYLAPEYFMHGKVSDKVDVYAFGVVLLELLSGRKPINSGCPKGQESLVLWANSVLKSGKVSELLDPSLDSRDSDQEKTERMVLAATLCIRRSPRLRPCISVVLKLLQGDEEAARWAKQLVSAPEDQEEVVDGEPHPSNIQSHLNLALLDMEDDSLSICSSEQSISIEDYLRGSCD